MYSYELKNEDYSKLKSMTLGMRIKYFRNKIRSLTDNKQAFSATEVAKRIGISFQSLSAIENDKTKSPSFEVITSLCKEFGIPIDALTDEYYKNHKPDLVISSKDEPLLIAEIKTPQMESRKDEFSLGFLMYQRFKDGVRVIFNEETINNVDDNQFINIMAKLLSDLQLTNEQLKNNTTHKFSTDNESPYNKALKIFHSISRKEQFYASIPKDEWSNLLLRFNKEEINNEQK